MVIKKQCIYYSAALGVENSFGNPVVRRRFYKKYYQLLLHGQFPMKESKLCLIGPPDSRNTSWFSPFEGELFVLYMRLGVTSINCLLDLILLMFYIFLKCRDHTRQILFWCNE